MTHNAIRDLGIRCLKPPQKPPPAKKVTVDANFVTAQLPLPVCTDMF